MSRLIRLIVLLVIFMVCPVWGTESDKHVIREWNFGSEQDVEQWKLWCHLDEVSYDLGVFKATITGNDPFIGITGLDIPDEKFLYLEFELKTNNAGRGDLYYSNNPETGHAGLSQSKTCSWTAYGDDQWHTYRIFPDWAAEGTIRKLRLDFPIPAHRDSGKPTIEMKSFRIVKRNPDQILLIEPQKNFLEATDNWFPVDTTVIQPSKSGLTIHSTSESVPEIESGFFGFDAGKEQKWVSLELTTKTASTCTLEWLSDAGKIGMFAFPILNDGRSHWYNIDLAQNQTEPAGKTHYFKIVICADDPCSAVLQNLSVSDSPQGPPDVVVDHIWFSEPINRAGKTAPLSIKLTNIGGTVSEDLKIMRLTLPGGEKIVSPEGWEKLPVIKPMQTIAHTIDILCEKPQECLAVLRFDGFGAPQNDHVVSVDILPDLKLPKADYVPEPKPVESDYEIGAFYFPGWAKADQWQRIISTHPERKPVLGWYDEANPEVIDWQIKWAVENGLKFFLVDWYWSRGNQHLDHWVNGFQRARYKSYLKWAVMWANHNGPGSHSEEDQAKVTQFWIDNYFKTPEYYTIDGKPVVMIWSPQGMDEDIINIEAAKGNTLKKGQGVKKLLDLSRKMAKDAGLEGVYFIAMKWPEGSTDAKDIQWLADAGFDMTSIYHFMDHNGKAKNPMRFSFDLVVDANKLQWGELQKTGILPFLPNISTGWDSRPWHGNENVIIDDRTIGKFRVICEDFAKFSNQTGIKRAILGPLNEWGEGSYVEPNLEHGFGMYEVLREIFCKEPPKGWPLNYAPSDVGLGPYDLPVEFPGR